MKQHIILASGSDIRATLLRNAGLEFDVIVPRVDEQTMTQSLIAEAASPRDIADALAEMKALRVAAKNPDALVIGCDQVLAHGRELLSKPQTPEQAIAQLKSLRGQTHQLACPRPSYYAGGKPQWRHVGQTRLFMRDVSDAYLDAYVARNWDSIRHAVGAYKLEEEGARLFSRVEGDYFNVLGIPLLELLSYLTLRGTIDG